MLQGKAGCSCEHPVGYGPYGEILILPTTYPAFVAKSRCAIQTTIGVTLHQVPLTPTDEWMEISSTTSEPIDTSAERDIEVEERESTPRRANYGTE